MGDEAYEQMKRGMRWMWSLGDYSQLARLLEPHAHALADRCAITPGMDVLDVATGNGNFALVAAERGARVTALDFTPAMLDLARARGAAAGLDIGWIEGDAESLPFPDARFDLVASVFGVVFAPRPELVAAELGRVTAPGGAIAMANWSPGGFLHGMSEIGARYVPPPAAPLPSPFQWGIADVVRVRLGGAATTIDIEERSVTFDFPSAEEGLSTWERINGPQVALQTRLAADEYASLRRDYLALMDELNTATDGGVRLSAPYLSVLARRAAAAA